MVASEPKKDGLKSHRRTIIDRGLSLGKTVMRPAEAVRVGGPSGARGFDISLKPWSSERCVRQGSDLSSRGRSQNDHDHKEQATHAPRNEAPLRFRLDGAPVR